MTRQEFRDELAFILNDDAAQLTDDRAIESIQGFDSVAMLSLIAFFDGQLGVRVNVDALRQAKTIGDLARLAQDKLT